MALRFHLQNLSTGEIQYFRFDDSLDEEVLQVADGMQWLKENHPEVASLIREKNIYSIDCDAGYPLTTRIDTVENVEAFLSTKNADAEWDIPGGMRYIDWLACMEIITTHIDPEAVTYDEKHISVVEYDEFFIDMACGDLDKAYRHLTCHKHIFKDCYTREYEDEVIQ